MLNRLVSWIIIPNRAYDRLEEPYRMLLMIGIFLFLLIGFMLLDLMMIGFFLFGLLGLYRISYFLVEKKNGRVKEDC